MFGRGRWQGAFGGESDVEEKKISHLAVFKRTLKYLWPDDTMMRMRVVASLFCLLVNKLAELGTPIGDHCHCVSIALTQELQR